MKKKRPPPARGGHRHRGPDGRIAPSSAYATYVKDRYTGFSGDSPRNAPPADLQECSRDLPRRAFAKNRGGTPSLCAPAMHRAPCGPRGRTSCKKDIANLKRPDGGPWGRARLQERATSPGVLSSLFLQQSLTPDRGGPIRLRGRAMRVCKIPDDSSTRSLNPATGLSPTSAAVRGTTALSTLNLSAMRNFVAGGRNPIGPPHL